MSELTLTDKINELENAMVVLPQADCPVVHTFHNGIYMRQVTLAAGITAIGHHQRFDHINIMVSGEVTILNDDGTLKTLTAPLTFIGKPGRKVGYVHKKTIWINVYHTNETDIETLEDMFLDKSLSIQIKKPVLLKLEDHADFNKMLEDTGYTAEIVKKQSESSEDQIPFPPGNYKCAVFKSDIEGKGLFATGDILAGEIIAPARIDTLRTPAGRYINHSKSPNAEMVVIDNIIYVKALKNIKGCQASLPGDEITTDYRKNVELVRGLLCQE